MPTIAEEMAAAHAREEEYQAWQDQLQAAHIADTQNQLNEAVTMLAELLGVSFEAAGRRVAERLKGKSEAR